MIESKVVWKTGAFWAGVAAGSPAMLVALVCLVATCEARAVDLPRPGVPPELKIEAGLIDLAEVILRQAAPPPLRETSPVPGAVRHFVLDRLDGARRGPKERNPELSRWMRLDHSGDEEGQFCFIALGLSAVAFTMADVAEATGNHTLAGVLRGAGDSIRRKMDRDNRCGGPGGRQATKEWEVIQSEAARDAGRLHREAILARAQADALAAEVVLRALGPDFVGRVVDGTMAQAWTSAGLWIWVPELMTGMLAPAAASQVVSLVPAAAH